MKTPEQFKKAEDFKLPGILHLGQTVRLSPDRMLKMEDAGITVSGSSSVHGSAQYVEFLVDDIRVLPNGDVIMLDPNSNEQLMPARSFREAKDPAWRDPKFFIGMQVRIKKGDAAI